MNQTATLKRTSLYPLHLELGAKMIPFAGWEMPVQYAGIIQEHRTVRESVGLFDISHMGEIEVRGPQAEPLLQKLTSNNIGTLEDGGALYTCLLNQKGGILDDLLVYRISEGQYFLCVNAANADSDFQWIKDHSGGFADVDVENRTDHYSLLSLQGPRAEEVIKHCMNESVSRIKYFHHANLNIESMPVMVSRTGYTGEDGFELFFDSKFAEPIWKKLLGLGRDYGILPIGLGARDTLRLEMRYLLHGSDMDTDHTPLEAGLGWTVKWDKGEFIGKEELLRQREKGVNPKLVGFEMVGRGIPRKGYPIEKEGELIGEVTSGTSSPSLKKSIGLGYVKTPFSTIEMEWDVVVRDQRVRCRVVQSPFYQPRVKR